MNRTCDHACFVSPISPILRTAASKRGANTQPCMSFGRFARREFLQYIPLFVTLYPGAVRSQINRDESKTASASAEDVNQHELPKADIDPSINEPEVTDRAYLDISINDRPAHRITLALYGGLAPKTVANFLALCENGFTNTKVYRIVPGLTVQLGDVLNNNGKSGLAATESGWLDAETFRLMHTVPGIVSMVTKNGRVDSRFFVATRKGDSRYLDGKYVGFGRVTEGMGFLDEVEREGEGFVRKPVRVVASGILR